MTDGQVCLPNATHVRAEPPNEVVSSVEQQMVMIHGEFSPNSINVNPEDEQPFKDVLLGLISSEQGPSIRDIGQLKMWLLLRDGMSTEI